MKILHIEDNPADARLFSKILSEAEAQAPSIIVKETLEEGLAVLKSTVFDAVFIDLNLSDSRGIGTLHAVLATHPGLPVIALTGMNDDELGSQAIKDGAQDYLPKDDLTPSGLRRSLRYGIERKKLMLKLEQQTQKARQEVEDLRKMIQPVKTHAVSSSIGFSDSQLRAFVLEYSQMLKQVQWKSRSIKQLISIPNY